MSAIPSATPATCRVVVGVDGSPGARSALVAALAAAAQRGAVLDVVTTYLATLVWSGALMQTADDDTLRTDAERRTRRFVDEVRTDPAVTAVPGADDVEVRLVVTEGRPVPVLTERARGADLLVVGSRGRGALRSALLGSVALHCVSSAPCPVLVVHPGRGPADRRPRVLVGVDGSSGSWQALRAGLDEARRRRADLSVLAAFVVNDPWLDTGSVVLPAQEEVRADLQSTLDALVAEATTMLPGARVPVTTEVVQGAPSEVLLERAREADLLVLGSHGRGALRGLLLGSVALHCALHAPVPVMVVPDPSARPPVDEEVSESD